MSIEIEGKRQHTLSMPKKLYEILAQEASARGLTVGELNRSIVRCWVEQKDLPARFARPELQIQPVREVKPAAQPPPPLTRVKVEPPPMPQNFSVADVMRVQKAQAELRAEAAAAHLEAVAPVTPAPITRLPDPDFDSPEVVREALDALANRKDEVPF
jgi:hypothetical protein